MPIWQLEVEGGGVRREVPVHRHDGDGAPPPVRLFAQHQLPPVDLRHVVVHVLDQEGNRADA